MAELIQLYGYAFVLLRARSASVSRGKLELQQDGEVFRFSEDTCLAAGDGASGQVLYIGYCTLQALTHSFNTELPVQLSLTSGTDTWNAEVRLKTVDPLKLPTLQGRALIASAFERLGRADIAQVLAAKNINFKGVDALGPFHVDRAIGGGAGFLIDGWMARLGERDVHITTADLCNWAPRSSIAARSRSDVHEYLKGIKAETGHTDRHGFVAVIPSDAARPRDLFFVEMSASGTTATFCGPITPNVIKDDPLSIEVVKQAFGDIRSLPATAIPDVYGPLLAVSAVSPRAQRFEFGPKPAEGPITSIIIPFYGDAFFLNCVYHLHRVLDHRFEIIAVVDDPRIWPETYNSVLNRSTAIPVPTVLLRNLENYGYGPANNIGVKAARGDVLILMNSDIMVTDPTALVNAAESIRRRRLEGPPESVIGFSLLYEDDTIQHIGMEFPRSSQVGNLRLADHPMKGLPFAFYKGEPVRTAPAVTAALMAISADLYRELGGFDAVYVRGDFEDADLCLRARNAGASVEVHVHPGLYHLERQSIPSIGSNDLRGMITYLNCVEFNRRWDGTLSRPKKIFRVEAPTNRR
jgi:GT2 family glycosyltransferase